MKTGRPGGAAMSSNGVTAPGTLPDELDADDFSVMMGGPLLRLAWAIGIPRGIAGSIDVGLVLALVSWVPLLALCAAAGTLVEGPTMPFLYSVGPHVRLLVAIPMFFVAEAYFDRRTGQALQTIVASRVIPAAELPQFRGVLARARRFRDAWFIEGILLAIVAFLIWDGIRPELAADITTWRNSAEQQLTPAGRWYAMVSLPVFQFLIWRWAACLLIWGWVIWRMLRLELRLVPTHPDRAGGLGPLGVAHVSLAPLNFALTALVVAIYAEDLLYAGLTIDRVTRPMTVAIIGDTLILLAPLLLCTRRLIEARQRGLLEYGDFAASYTQAFDDKWLRGGKPDDALLGSADVQSLADLSNSFDMIGSMRIVPLRPNQLLVLVVAGILPTLPLALFVLPLDELILRGVQALLPL